MLKIFKTEEELAYTVFEEMKNQLVREKSPVFCLASGSTPKKIYGKFSEKCGQDENLEKLKIVSLDEWVGVKSTVTGSCYQMLNKDLFNSIKLNEKNIVFYETVDSNLDEECRRIDEFIESNPITFSLMGVGMNGHIGLNEPNDEVRGFSSVVKLSDKTKEVATKYFDEVVELSEGITLGLKQIIKAKRTIVVITGEHKSNIVKEIFENKDANLPAQTLLGYEHIDFYIDEDAAKLLSTEGEDK